MRLASCFIRIRNISLLTCAFGLCGAAAFGDRDVEVAFELAATNLQGSGVVVVYFDEGSWDEETATFSWVLPAPIEILGDDNNYVATVIDAAIFARCSQPCEIEMYLGVAAGVSNTTFIARSPLVSFPTIPQQGAAARAVASVTLTDANEGTAALSAPEGDGTGVFRMYYNGYQSEGTCFTHLVGVLRVTNGGTITAVQTDPAAGYRSIGEAVSDISSEISFVMTGGDVAFMNASAGMPTPPACEGDVDGNGIVDALDLNLLLAIYGMSASEDGFDEAADLVADGQINLADLNYLLAAYGDSCW